MPLGHQTLNEGENEAFLLSPDDIDVGMEETVKTTPNRMVGQPPSTALRRNAKRGLMLEKETEESDAKDTDYLPSDSEVGEDDAPKKTARWKKRNEDQWKKNQRKRKTRRGEEHTTIGGKLVVAKKVQPINCKCKFRCNAVVSQAAREEVFQVYWNMESYNQKKDFIIANTDVRKAQRSRVLGNKEPMRSTVDYFLPVDNERTRVCQAFFRGTLSISKKSVVVALKNVTPQKTYGSTDKRGNATPINKTTDKQKETVMAHIKSFPCVESHYCRKDSRRMYLDANLTVRKMYILYKEFAANNSEEKPVSEAMYRIIFSREFNLSFFKPKKDQCELCSHYKSGSLSQEVYDEHSKEKDRAQEEKEKDKKRASMDQGFHSATFDLQSVLQIPCSEVSQMYYKRKLCAYNFTIYEQTKPNNAFCFLWSEVDGGRGACEIGTCVFQYLEQLPENVSEVCFFSDTCGAQNRNQYLAAMYLYALKKIPQLRVIEHKYLVSGHTHMECDSMHAAIEFAKRHQQIYSLHDWENIIRGARKAKPFNIKLMAYYDFMELKQIAQVMIKNRNKSESGELINWLKIRALRFEKERPESFQFKLSFDDPYQLIECAGQRTKADEKKLDQMIKEFPPLYRKKLPISIAKKNDLLSLCKSEIIPKQFHQFFKSLPSHKDVKDATTEAAVEEDDDVLEVEY